MIIPVNTAIKEDDLYYKNDNTTVSKGYRGLNLFGKIKFSSIIASSLWEVHSFHRKTLKKRECYIGPFWGEFGNFLLHFLPYIVYLHKRGIKLNLCCLENYIPFLTDEKGNKIYAESVSLRDFFKEMRPTANTVNPPEDVYRQYLGFKQKAEKSGLPFLDLSKADLYWYIFRNWQLHGKQDSYHLEKVYKKNSESSGNNAVIFPRKKGTGYTLNNGEAWNYMEVAKSISPYFDKVFITGHPSMSADVYEADNIKLCLSANNTVIMGCCANSNLIITQHSGAMHLGSYFNVPVLVIFKGNLPIKGLDDSIRFIKNIQRQNIYIALHKEEIVNFVREKLYIAKPAAVMPAGLINSGMK